MKPAVQWINRRSLLLLHEESLAIFGGARGLRDEALFESALARPQNRLAYQPEATLAELAASYAYGLARNHPFVDGNKRAALLAIGLFLGRNGLRLRAPQVDAIRTIQSLATGTLTEAALATWIAAHAEPRR